MKIVDLDEKNRSLYFLCLEDWSEEIKEAGDHKELWYSRMKDKGLRVKFALDKNDTIGGMIQYAPIEHSFVEGKDLYFIFCIWIHGYKQGRGDFRRQGMGKALLKAAEDDVKSLGAKGIAAWGLRIPIWMKASWFKKYGYKVADTDGFQAIVWKPFSKDAQAPRWMKKVKSPSVVPGKVTVTSFCHGWCPAQNLALERAKRAVEQINEKDRVIFQQVDTFDRNNLSEWGLSDALFIDDHQVRTGPPPSYDSIRKIIEKKVKRLR
jgi:GNAT superfamily N-acetyltransferase